MVEVKEDTDKALIERRIADWIARLDALYEQVEKWRAALLPDSIPISGEVLQREEELMRYRKVKARMVPTYAFRSARQRIAFAPTALWVEGANGRVNITADHPSRQYILADLGGKDGQPSNWQIAVKDAKRFLVPFNRAAFAKLIENRL